MAAPGAIESRPPQGEDFTRRRAASFAGCSARAVRAYSAAAIAARTADADIRASCKITSRKCRHLRSNRARRNGMRKWRRCGDYRALRKYIRDPQSLSDEQLQAILDGSKPRRKWQRNRWRKKQLRRMRRMHNGGSCAG